MTPEEIREALARIERRQDEFQHRLAQLENAARAPVGAPSAAPAGVSPARPAPVAAAPPAVPRPGARDASRPRNLETAFGLTWISRIAVVTVVLALAFFFEYAFENHWITEAGRVWLGIAAGGLALLFGERFWRGGQRAYAQALTAAGIAFLYLSVWAAFGLYRLIAQPAAFGLMVVATAAAGALALRYNGAAVAILGLAGGFATPLLLGGGGNPWFVLGYVLVLDLGAALAARARGWPWLEPLAVAGTVVLYSTRSPAPPGLRPLYTAFVLLYYGVFAASLRLGVFLAAQVLASLAVAYIWTPAAGALWLLWILALAGLALADRRAWPAAVGASFAGFWLAYGAWYAQPGNPPPVSPLAALTAAFLIFLAWPVWRVLERRRSLGFQDLSLLALNAGFYFGACHALLLSGYGAFEGLFAVGVAVLHMGAARLLWGRDGRGSVLAAGVAWVLLVLAVPVQFAGYRITIAWALEGAAMAWAGIRLHEPRAQAGSLAIFAMAVLRLAFIDSRMYPNPAVYGALANPRLLTFAVAAAALLSAAWWMRRGRRALALYVGGHAILLWGLGLEAAGWAARTAAPQNVRSVASTSISVLAAAYAVLLVAAGTARPNASTRVLGIALIGLVVLKLYLYDVWLLGQFYRMAAFAILGLLLLLISYLYSRFRRSIETWWRP